MKELKLISADRQILQCHHKWENDRLINAAQQMLHKQYVVPGLEDVSKGGALSMDAHQGEFIQILNVGKVHWVTVSPHHWTVSLAKHSPMMFTNVLKNLITVWNVKQAVGLHCI